PDRAHFQNRVFQQNRPNCVRCRRPLRRPTRNSRSRPVAVGGDEVRVSAQLVRAADGYQIWSQSYDRKLDDIFAIQDGIAADAVKQLKVKLLGAAPKARVTDPRAYALYLQAWDGLARNFSNETIAGVLPNAQGLRQAREVAGRALAIDPDYAPAQAMLGYLAMVQSDLPAAARYLERALALDPTDLGVLNNSAALLTSLGRLP